MNKLKEENLRRALSHIERHKQAINTSNNSDDNDFHKLLLQFSYEVYERIKANKKPYPNLDQIKSFDNLKSSHFFLIYGVNETPTES